METSRLKQLTLAAALAVCGPVHLFASGDWFDSKAPSLDEYLQRLPAKSVGQILAETRPAKPTNAPNGRKTVAELGRRSQSEPAEKLLGEVDALLVAARSAHSSAAELSLIHDLRDALVSAPKEAGAYIAWHCEHFVTVHPVWKSSEDESAPATPTDLAAELEKKAEEASKPLRAHWLYLRAALDFNRGNKGAALRFFDKILKQFPKHPRAELALLMEGRCLVSESRSSQYSEKRIGNPTAHHKAQQCFEEYLRRYPNGRFVADAYGWLGGLAWDEEDRVAALGRYLQQAEIPGHPEDLKSAAIMIEKALRSLSQDPKGDEAFALAARHPQAATAMLYLLLGSSDAGGAIDPYEEVPKDPVGKLRQWRSALLPRLASAVAAQKEIYRQDARQLKYVVILAHAASNAGKQEEALRLLALGKDLPPSDDLLFANAIVLQRAGKPKEAIPVFHSLLEQFPSSPLAPATRIRLALALRDNHQAGLALVQLRKLSENVVKSTEDTVADDRPLYISPPDAELSGIESVFYPNYGNAEKAQVDQEIDTLLNFAPIPELAGALDDAGLEPGFAADVRAILAARALAHEDFATAKRYMTPAQYGLLAAKLEDLTQQAARAGSPKEKAELQASVGDAWATARGKLLGIPLDTVDTKEKVFADDRDLAEARRKQNGRTMGFKDLDSELQAREELRHACRWWFDAARALPGAPVSAAARLKVLEAQAVIARSNRYAFQRAAAENLAGVSRQIYDRLKKECPDSSEAAQAAYWNVPAAPELTANPIGYDTYFRDHESGYRWPDFHAFLVEKDDVQSGEADIDAVATLRNDNGLAALKKHVSRLRLSTETSPAARNCLEDLALFLDEPAVTWPLAHDYVELRLDVLASAYTGEGYAHLKVAGVAENADGDAIVRQRIAKAAADPKMQPVRDYLDFLDAAMVANHRVSVETPETSKGEPFTYLSRDFPALEKMTRAFLERYPKSKKREAARLLLARAVLRLSWPWYDFIHPAKGSQHFTREPEFKRFQREPFEPKPILAELNAYDSEYPQGRYAADIRSMRAAVLWRAGTDWPAALDITLDILDRGTADLKEDASLRLANIFAELATPQKRPALLAALRKNPKSVERLKEYLDHTPGNLDHPLVLMGAFLGEQLGFKWAPRLEKADSAGR